MNAPALYGMDLFDEPIEPPKRGIIADEFVMPPFSVLNAREGFWQNRKRAWIALGIKSEVGRSAAATWGDAPSGGSTIDGTLYTDSARAQAGKASPTGSAFPACDYRTRAKGTGSGTPIPGTEAKPRPTGATFGTGGPGSMDAQRKEWKQELVPVPAPPGTNSCWRGSDGKPAHNGRRPHGGSLDERPCREPGTEYGGDDAWVASAEGSGTSIFDPVLCELSYRWFSPANGQILDPFAGGSVRGVVATLLGRSYWGCDLRPEQIEANLIQAETITPTALPEWVCGDSLQTVTSAPLADFVFSCPPYGNLEVYSELAEDLSAMEWPDFLTAYRAIIAASCARLKDNRFACFVVGDFRDGKGNYRNFVGETVAAFQAAGLHFYNEAILVTAVGSLPIRIGKQFASGRKLGKTHQNVLVFLKGDAKKAAAACQAVPV